MVEKFKNGQASLDEIREKEKELDLPVEFEENEIDEIE